MPTMAEVLDQLTETYTLSAEMRMRVSALLADDVHVRDDGTLALDDATVSPDDHCSACEQDDDIPYPTSLPCVHVLAARACRLLTAVEPDPVPVDERAPLVPLPGLPEALPLRPIAAIVADLSRPLPEACIAYRQQGGTQLSYLHWQHVTRLLDAYAPGWSGQVMRIETVGKNCVVTYRVAIPAQEGLITREATGMEEEAMQGYGDPTSNAEAMAFKRAAAKFGLGAYLYDKDATAQALATHLKTEKTHALQALAVHLDTLGLEREPVITWLRAQTGAARNADIPLAAITALLLHFGGTLPTASPPQAPRDTVPPRAPLPPPPQGSTSQERPVRNGALLFHATVLRPDTYQGRRTWAVMGEDIPAVRKTYGMPIRKDVLEACGFNLDEMETTIPDVYGWMAFYCMKTDASGKSVPDRVIELSQF